MKEMLHEIQEAEGLRAGNKIRKAHIQWKKSPMKVNLAAQTLSSSVADAIDFCRDIKVAGFEASASTTDFIRRIDRWFDIMNSRNPLGRGFKAPLSTKNESSWRPFLHETIQYILSLRWKNGTRLVDSSRKTGFIGVVLSCESIVCIFDQLVGSHETHLKYLLTYKMSQDHLELFFNAIRARGRWCVNPTPRHLYSAYKRLLVRHKIKASNGNVTAMEKTTILFATRKSITRYRDTVAQCDSLTCALSRAYAIDDNFTDNGTARSDNLDALPSNINDEQDGVDNELMELDLGMPLNYSPLSEFTENTVALIAGYVVRMVFKRVQCMSCCSVLCSGNPNDNRLKLILQKSNGGLIFPSPRRYSDLYCD